MKMNPDSTMSSRTEARARISELDAQISDLELALDDLWHKRRVIQEQLDSYIYPVLTLPNEILSEIFTHFLPVYPECPPLVGLLSPSTLGQVCRKWREIAVPTPSLWRAIGLDLDLEYHPNQLRLFETWLERSGVTPLSINLRDYEPGLDISPVVTAVVGHAFHCEEMKLHISLSDIQILSSQNLPTLRALTIDPSEECPHGADPIILFDQAPNLANITLGRYFDPFRLVLPWMQITTLCGICLFVDELMEILRLAVNLVHCSVTIHGDNVVGIMPVPHMHLQDLTVMAMNPFGYAGGLLDNLTLPALRNLRIPEPWISPTPCATLTAWISRSGCGLEQLHVTESSCNRELSYREALPSIRKIVVDALIDDEEYYDYSAEEDSDDDDWTHLFPLC
ncbi:hypothetical protein FB451DRAFT_1090586 [Mycena latifolia]|nr:hypothetical protein FB451DRAFT_1090586 [Mycena latifolia]